MEETHTFMPVMDWLYQISNLGMIIFLMGALMQYVLLRFRAQITIPQTFPIIVITRIISIVLAWSISMFIPQKVAMVRTFVYIPAVISEVFLLIFTYFVIGFMNKKKDA